MQRASQMSSTFKTALESLYHVSVMDEKAPYQRQGRRYQCEKEVREMVEALSGETLFQPTPGRYHPGFEHFSNEAHLRNPSRLRGTMVVYSHKLRWGREQHLLEDIQEGDGSDTEEEEENQEDDEEEDADSDWDCSPVLLCLWLLICAVMVFWVLCPAPTCCIPAGRFTNMGLSADCLCPKSQIVTSDLGQMENCVSLNLS